MEGGEMRSATRLLAVACVALASGMAMPGCGTTTEDNASLADRALPKSHARLKIYRESVLGAAVAANVKIDNRDVASIGVGGSTILDIPAGSRKIVVGGWSHPNEYTMTLDARPGTYTLEISVRSEAMVAGMFGIVGSMVEAAANENGGTFQIRTVSAEPLKR
jgi:hypothetical protein